MNARNVYSILAAGLNHPDRILEWQDQPDFLRNRGVVPDSLDLEALWKFAGVAAKVRHNGLRQDFPLTFRLMRTAGLDVELFSSYATACSAIGHKYANNSIQRARDLITFLREWREPDCLEHSLLWDIIRHELSLLELKSVVGTEETGFSGREAQAREQFSEDSIPQANQSLLLHQMEHNPRDIESMLGCEVINLEAIPSATCYFGYWRSPQTNRIQILDLDAFSFYALRCSDGTMTLSELNRKLGGEGRLTPAFNEAIEQLVAVGMLTLQNSLLSQAV